jgi:ABC-type Mn2+/Zn2+ transport system permease subunit
VIADVIDSVIDYVTDPFGSTIAQRALLGGLVVAAITALIGTWVIVRGLAFLGDALAHGVLPGLAVGVMWGISLTLAGFVSALAMVAGVNLVHRTTRLSDDTGIGLLFVGMLALGVILISRNDTGAGDLTSFLFGDILGVDRSDIWLALVALGITIVALLLGHRSFLALAVNHEKARALGLRPGLAHAAMLALLAMAVVVSFKIVGTLLVFGFLVAPAATAVLLVRRIPRTMVVAVLLAWLSVVVGIVVSYHAETATSATIAGIGVAIFFVVLAAVEASAALERGRTPTRA